MIRVYAELDQLGLDGVRHNFTLFPRVILCHPRSEIGKEIVSRLTHHDIQVLFPHHGVHPIVDLFSNPTLRLDRVVVDGVDGLDCPVSVLPDGLPNNSPGPGNLAGVNELRLILVGDETQVNKGEVDDAGDNLVRDLREPR